MTTMPVQFFLTLIAAVGAGTAPAQTSQPATQPELTFARGEPRAVDSKLQARRGSYDERGLDQLTVFGILETRPSLSAEALRNMYVGHTRLLEAVTHRSLVEVFGEPQPGRESMLTAPAIARCFRGEGLVEYSTREEGGAAVADVWTIRARDEESARALVQAVLQNLCAVRAELLRERQEVEAKAIAEATQTRHGIVEKENRVQTILEECGRLGIADMTDEAIDSTIARLEQEQRLNQIDIAGIEASLGAVKNRLNGRESSPETSVALARMQVELDINLVGKLARKDAIGKELKQLQTGRSTRAPLRDLQRQIPELKTSLAECERALHRLKETVERLRQVADVEILSPRIELHPILAEPEAKE